MMTTRTSFCNGNQSLLQNHKKKHVYAYFKTGQIPQKTEKLKSNSNYIVLLNKVGNSTLCCYQKRVPHFMVTQEANREGKPGFVSRRSTVNPWCFFCLPVGALLLQRPSEDLFTTHRCKERLGWFLQFTSHKLKTLYAIKPDQSVSWAIQYHNC